MYWKKKISDLLEMILMLKINKKMEDDTFFFGVVWSVIAIKGPPEQLCFSVYRTFQQIFLLEYSTKKHH